LNVDTGRAENAKLLGHRARSDAGEHPLALTDRTPAPLGCFLVHACSSPPAQDTVWRVAAHGWYGRAASTSVRTRSILVVNADAGMARWQDLPSPQAEQALMACCACASWARQVAAARPYPDRPSLRRSAASSLAVLSWAEVREALDAHPRIGERAAHAGPEAAWSRQEQSAMDTASEVMRVALAEVNAAYEARFGHIFLIAAAGRSDAEILVAARQRLHHDEGVERDVVRAELAAIVGQRLERMLDS
jgi:2-oxo-4-hydroxy-4-carboxy-5-ureidoimidazoline decarboxylase